MQNQTQPVFSHTGPASTCQAQLQKKGQSPQERNREGEGGGREERETRQSPGCLFFALLIVWVFSLVLFVSHYHYSLLRGNKLHGGCHVGWVSQGACCKRLMSEGRETDGSEGSVQEWKAGMQKAEAMLNQAEQLHWYENTKWEQRVGRKYRKKQPEALAPWTASSASWWLLICHPCEGQRGFPKVIYHNLCRRS